MEKVYIIGAGGHGQVVADALMKAGIIPAGFLDDNELLAGKDIMGIPVVGKIKTSFELGGKFVVAIGDNGKRKRIVKLLGFPESKFFTVIHPSAVVGFGVQIGAGAMIIGGSVINTGAKIGKHTIINTSASIDHHNSLGNFVHIAPGTHTAGNVKVAEGAFVGTGSSIVPGIEIGEWAVVGAGSVVIKDVPAYTVVAGVPAKTIRRLK